jgi:cobalt-precorrin 5A hydrolase / precorrin-3B C17-methyltransferase
MQLGICASQEGFKQLEPLLNCAELEAILVPNHLLDEKRPQLLASNQLSKLWPDIELLLGAMAAGALIRLIAPLLQTKNIDPAVLLLSGNGQQLIPLLGGHAAGGDRYANRLAPLFQASVLTTGFSSSNGRIGLDNWGFAWGWQKGQGLWDELMKKAARNEVVLSAQNSGEPLALASLKASDVPIQAAESEGEAELLVSANLGPGCRWHPPVLWLGIGCERNSSLLLLQKAVTQVFSQANLAEAAVAGIASLDLKADEPALLALAAGRQWPLRFFRAEALDPIKVPNPSAAVAKEVGTASVAEAAALAAAGPGAELIAAKAIFHGAPGEGAVTVAIAKAAAAWAPQRGSLQLVGAGPGCIEQLTGAARSALAAAQVWVGYSLYLDLLEPLRRKDQARLEGQLTQERQRCQESLALACQGVAVALISSGESGMYGMAGLALEEWLQLPEQERPAFTVHPGISAFQMAAARLGAPLMHDLCTVSLSDRLTPWAVIEKRLQAAAIGDFVVALYNPRSQGRSWQLARAIELLLEQRDPATPAAICRQLGRTDEAISLHQLAKLPVAQVDMFSLILIGNSSTKTESGLMLTPRGYPGAELS